MPIAKEHVLVGAGLFLNPGLLEERGARRTSEVQKSLHPHYFIIVALDGDRARMLELTSKPDNGDGSRVEIPETAKAGHPGSTRKTTYAVWAQEWYADVDDVVDAADGDFSNGENKVTELAAVLAGLGDWNDPGA